MSINSTTEIAKAFVELRFILEYLESRPEIKTTDENGYRSIPNCLFELNELLIKILISADIYYIKKDLETNKTDFLVDVLKGEYFTPYYIYEREAPYFIILHFLNQGFTESSENFEEEISVFWRKDLETCTVSELVYKFIELTRETYTYYRMKCPI